MDCLCFVTSLFFSAALQVWFQLRDGSLREYGNSEGGASGHGEVGLVVNDEA